MFYDLLKNFWSEMLHFDALKTDYLATITAICLVFGLLMLFIGIFTRTGSFHAILLVVVITISLLFATDHYFEHKDAYNVSDEEAYTEIAEGGEGV